jgi:hypothetical protein
MRVADRIRSKLEAAAPVRLPSPMIRHGTRRVGASPRETISWRSSGHFAGMSRVERQRTVYAVLAESQACPCLLPPL